MTDILSGTIDLDRLQSRATAGELIATLDLRGEFRASDATRACALIGTPRFVDAELEAIRRREGPAAALLSAWRTGATATPAKIRGSYAAIIVDADAGEVFLMVDRFARRSLCYALEGRRLLVSDRADRIGTGPRVLDPQAVFDYLFFHMIPAPRTIFQGVRRLPAAHSLLVDRNGMHETSYWPLRFDESHRESFADARSTFLNLIRSAVAEEIDGADQVGAFLSGGTDSSTIAGMLGEVSGSPARTYSIGFEAEGYDEMEYARIAARHFGCEHHEYYVTPADLLKSIPAIASHHDQPFGNSSALPSFYCAQMARADGCTKMLAGDGGDELFGGNARYAVQRFLQMYQNVPHGLRRIVEPMCGDDSILRRIPGFRQATGYVRHSRVPMPHRLETLNLVMQLDPARVLQPAFLAAIDTTAPARHMEAVWQDSEADSLINRMLAYDWRFTLADNDLPKVRGATTMAGIAVAYPLLDDRIADFSMSLRPGWKLRGFKLRWFFKEALRGFLPEAIITKKKHGFGLPYGPWMARDPALRRLAQDSLNGLVERGIVRAEFVAALFDRHLGEHPGYYGTMVWILMVLEQWLRAQPQVELPG